MKHYRIRNPRTRLLLAGFEPVTGQPRWTALPDQSHTFLNRAAAEHARARLQALARPPAAPRNLFTDVNVILQRHPHMAVQLLVQRAGMAISSAAVYVHARRKDWLARRLQAANAAAGVA